jgi:hypothetical protein
MFADSTTGLGRRGVKRSKSIYSKVVDDEEFESIEDPAERYRARVKAVEQIPLSKKE